MEKKIKSGWISPKILLAIGRLSNTDQVPSAKYWLASKMVIYYRSIHFYTNCMVTQNINLRWNIVYRILHHSHS